jgi:hypothetical protein
VTDQSSGRRSPTKAGGSAVWAETGAVRRLSVAVGGRGIEGKEVGEEARCTDACERKTVKRGMASGVAFLWRFSNAAGRKWVGEGVRLGAVWGQKRSREGGAGVRRRVSRHGTARARRLQAAQTAVGGTRHAGAADAQEQRRRLARATRGQRLTSGARRRGGPVAAAGCGSERE